MGRGEHADGRRPRRVVVVAGTGTEVGKTWVSAALAQTWRAAGRTVSARKPAQSFAPGEGPTDAEVLAAATGEAPEVVCPPHRWYEVPMAPPMAAAALDRPVPTIADLVDELGWGAPPSAAAPGEPVDVGIVEPAGGVRSPLAADGDTVSLVAAVRPDAVVLVADAGLGTINSVRLSVDALAGWPVAVLLNRFDPADALHRANERWLRDRDGTTLATAVDELATALDRLGPRPA